MKILPKQPEKRNKVVGVFLGATLAFFLGLCYHDKAENIPGASFLYNLMHRLEYKTLDLRFIIRGPLKQKHIDKNVVLLDYDDETEEWTPFPPDRAYYVEIIKALSHEDSKAAATFFDIFFFDPFGRQLDNDMAEVFREKFEALPREIQADTEMTGALKEKMFEVYDLLNSGASGEQLQRARRMISEIVSSEDVLKNIDVYNRTAEYLFNNLDLSQLAPDRDEVLHSAITGAGNVFLAQIVNNKEPTPYSIDDVLYKPEVHKAFSKLILMADRTQTETRTEVDVNFAIRNLQPEDILYLLGEVKPAEIKIDYTDCPDLKAAGEESGLAAEELIESEQFKAEHPDYNGPCIHLPALRAALAEHAGKKAPKKDAGNRAPIRFDRKVIRALAGEFAKKQTEITEAMKMNGKYGMDLPEKGSLTRANVGTYYRTLVSMVPSKEFVAENVAGLGYVKPEFQKYDGTIRAAAPASFFRGKMYPHIDLMLVMYYLGVGNKDVEFQKEKIILRNCKYPGSEKKETITIPLYRRGTMLVNWSGPYYNPNQFPHRSFHLIYETARQYNIVRKQEKIDILRNMLGNSEKQEAFFNMQTRESELAQASGEELEKLLAQVPPEEREEILARIPPEDLAAMPPEQQRDLILSEKGFQPQPLGASMTPRQQRDYRLQDLKPGDFKPAEWKLLETMTTAEIQNFVNSGLNPVESEIFAAMTPREIQKVIKDIEFFKGKISMTGLTAEGTHDLNPIPYHPRYPLVGMHANMVNTILKKLFIHIAPFSVFMIALLALGVFTGYIGGSRKHLPGAGITVGAILAFGIICQLLFNTLHIWFPFVPTLLALALIYLLVIIYRFMTEGQEAIRMKKMFSTYVNPSVVDTLIQNPDMLKLGGERMDLTAIFALASGPALETDDAEILVERLNEYFTIMTDQIFEYDGTLDKYEGKIIMAVYGAPVHFEDHPAKACLSLAGMKKALEELVVKWEKEGKGSIKTTVGCNSGPMIAGNMGSASRFNYTVMGDAVNLAARILGASIQYGVSYMISEYTYDRAKDDIIARMVDSIVVVGKEEPVRVYEIVAAKGDILSDDLKQFLEAYETGFKLYTERKWDEAAAMFEKAKSLRPDDKPTDMLLKRTRQYKETPPAEKWKGEFVLTSKGL